MKTGLSIIKLISYLLAMCMPMKDQYVHSFILISFFMGKVVTLQRVLLRPPPLFTT